MSQLRARVCCLDSVLFIDIGIFLDSNTLILLDDIKIIFQPHPDKPLIILYLNISLIINIISIKSKVPQIQQFIVMRHKNLQFVRPDGIPQPLIKFDLIYENFKSRPYFNSIITSTSHQQSFGWFYINRVDLSLMINCIYILNNLHLFRSNSCSYLKYPFFEHNC